MASYAPLFARLRYAQWSPNMIWFDGERSYASPSYYIQKLYSTQIGTHLLQTIADTEEIPFVVSYDREAGALFIKLANPLDRNVSVKIESDFSLADQGEVQVIQADEEEVNSIESPRRVAPITSAFACFDGMEYEVGAKSFHVLKIFRKDK
ncbi:alpha-L-arabinofuranosidase C-terminal domain-containing protein [Cohnella faecalis]|uniref:alpha-L-arabinofuranosidase C-terminal domain-containing protein n=1 Tax=Cohnella faecalis TaxID=2315694 RepID=UPI001314A751|nr:alpha-L-arabinofuranosidase C-terminal domain-containing protein [Cohnella faecalis]